MLQRFKDSNIKREREVFNCMLRNLFEEYRFFPQYPDKELHITACLFGGIIEKGLVTYMALGLALRYVLEALRKPFGSKMYYFGIAALDRFKNRYALVLFINLLLVHLWSFQGVTCCFVSLTRLKDYPQYCQHLASIAHFAQFPHHLQEVNRFLLLLLSRSDLGVAPQSRISEMDGLTYARSHDFSRWDGPYLNAYWTVMTCSLLTQLTETSCFMEHPPGQNHS